MKKLVGMVLAVLLVSATSSSAWWIFGKKSAEPVKDEAAAVDAQPGGASGCEAQKSKCCAKMTDEEKAAKCASMSKEDQTKCAAKKAKCEEKKAQCGEKKAKNAEKKAQCTAKKAEKPVEAPVEAAPTAE